MSAASKATHLCLRLIQRLDLQDEGKMIDRICFATFDPLRDVPQACNRCLTHPPVFTFEFHCHADGGEGREEKGHCCGRCAAELLKRLESAESREWAEEEAALRAEDLEIDGFRERRLSTFAHSHWKAS